ETKLGCAVDVDKTLQVLKFSGVVGEAGNGRLAHRGVREGVFLGGVHGHVVIAAHASVDEFDDHFLANVLEITVAPALEGKGGSRASAFLRRAIVGSS